MTHHVTSPDIPRDISRDMPRLIPRDMPRVKVGELESLVAVMEEERASNTERAAELATLQDKSIVSGDLIKRVSWL